MSLAIHVAARELKIGFRNPWAYTFMALFTLFMFSLLLINLQGYVTGYSGLTGTMLNLALYLLPLMALMLGSFSLTGDKEEGNWELLSTYALSTGAYMIGKYAGISIVMLSIVAAGFGLSGMVGSLLGGGFGVSAFLMLLLFAALLSFFFLAIATLIGTLARNRWQALTAAVGVWFFAIIAWPALLIAALGMLPFPMIKPAVTVAVFLNPAELTRLFTVVKLGGGSTLGPEYYKWVDWIQQPWGSAAFLGMALLWIAVVLVAAHVIWERRRGRV